MTAKETLLDQIERTFGHGYGVETANNSRGYVGVIMPPYGDWEFYREIRDADEVRQIKWGDDEFFTEFVGEAEQFDEEGNEANVWYVDEGHGDIVQVLTYPSVYE
jgi:hypothetical protein